MISDEKVMLTSPDYAGCSDCECAIAEDLTLYCQSFDAADEFQDDGNVVLAYRAGEPAVMVLRQLTDHLRPQTVIKVDDYPIWRNSGLANHQLFTSP